MISKNELVEGIRFAGERAAAAAQYCKDWDHQLGHDWTSGDAFRHIAAVAGGLAGMYPALDAGILSNVPSAQIAASNSKAISGLGEASREDVVSAIRQGHAASAAFAATLDEGDLAKVVTLGGYEMPKGEIVAQIWIQHAIAHAYEASARWPIQ
ncbi:MAG: maleylpyruvate isomerase N-terminal domain-containing protein [Dehalococcoidia bacterium]